MLAMYTTYAVSAFWHGFYASYYIWLFKTAMFTQLGRRFFTTDWAKYIPYTSVLKWPLRVWTLITFNYIGTSF